MRRILLNNLTLFFAAVLSLQTLSAEPVLKPVFMLFEGNGYSNAQIKDLEQAGSRIRQQIPPHILIADLPDTMNPSTLPSLKSHFTQAISVSQLEPFGPMAVAAGLQWNRRFVNDSQALGQNRFGAMRVFVAQKSLPAPMNLQVKVKIHALHCSWQAVDGAFYYEIESNFGSGGKNSHRTRTNLLQVDLPLPRESGTIVGSIRVRAVDHLQGEHKYSDDVFGSWSVPVTFETSVKPRIESLSRPDLTSPVDRYESEGFTVILEWIDTKLDSYRIQISPSQSFDDTLVDEIVSGGEFVCPSQIFHVGDSLYWRVQEWQDDISPWSSERRFHIRAPKPGEADMFINPEAPK